MNCKTFRTEIEEATAAVPLSGATRKHLGACAPCMEFYNERAALARLVGELERVGAPSDFEFRLRARMAAAESARRATFFPLRFAPGMASIALAALFGIVLAGALYLRQPNVSRPPAASADVAKTATLPADAAAPRDRMLVDPNTNMSKTTLKDASVNQVAKATSKPRRRASQSRSSNPSAQTQGGEASADFSIRSAQALDLHNALPPHREAAAGSTVAIPLRTSSEPLKVLLRDERGGSRVVSMKSVSFGSQELMGRSRETSAASQRDGEGVW
ncbi:MAG TPA: hypothetical protein VM934_04865 [Pyrinomonadaceae bacterium]|jgi:hypothetical protein|nr:hypothetical protein [Pyrinomonadaceae bacterium]